MSAAQIEKFVAFVARQPQVIEEAAKNASDTQAFVRSVTAYASKEGFAFTEQEATEWLNTEATPPSGGELSDTQLEAVAGGKGMSPALGSILPKTGKVKLKQLASVL